MPLVEDNPLDPKYNPITFDAGAASNLEDLKTTPEITTELEDEVVWDKAPIIKNKISLVSDSKTRGLGMLGFITPVIDKGLSIGASLSDIISESSWKTSDLNPTKEGLTDKELYKPENFSVIQNMMKRRFGMDLKENKQEDIVKSWRQFMKNRDMYQSVNALTMHNWLSKATPLDKKATKDSIDLWSKVGGAFQKDERTDQIQQAKDTGFVLNDKGQLDWKYYKDKPVSALYPKKSKTVGMQSVTDTAQAIVTDPVNIIPIITFGRIKSYFVKSAAKNLRKKDIALTISKVKKNRKLSQAKKENEITKAVNKLTFTAMQRADVQFSGMKKALLGSAGLNGMFNAGIDYLNQTSDIMADVKKDYSVGQTIAVTTLATILGGGVNFAYHALFNKAARNALGGASPTPWLFEEMVKNRAIIKEGAKTAVAKDVWKDLRPEKISAIGASLRNNTIKFNTWLDKVEEGAPLSFKAAGDPAGKYDSVYNAYMFGAPEAGVEGVEGLLRRYGIIYEGKRTYLKDADGKDIKDNFSNWLIDVTVAAPKEIKKEIRRNYRLTLGKNGPEKFRSPTTKRPINFDTAMNIIAADLSESGFKLGQMGNMRKKLSKDAKLTLDKTGNIQDDILDPIDTKSLSSRLNSFGDKVTIPAKGIWDSSAWVTKSFIRAIVTNPGTTWLNYQGWKVMTGLESTGRMAQMMLHGGNATIQALVGRRKYSANQFQLAQNIFDNQVYKTRSLLDLETTVDQAQSFMAFYPKAQKLMKWANGGVEVKDMNKYLDLAPIESTSKVWYKKPAAAVDWYVDKMQTLWGTKAMDIYSKSVEFMTSMDYLTRKQYNMGIDDFLNSKDAWRITETDQWTALVAEAVSNAQRNTFSKSFADMKGGLGNFAKFIENLRNIPLAGTKVPFGQFYNNTVAFQMEASGLSALHQAFYRKSKFYERTNKQALGRSIGEKAGFAAASWTAFFYMTASRKDALEEGLPWYAERDDAGRIRSYKYDYPKNLPMWLGTVGAHLAKGELPPEDLINEGIKTFTLEAFTRGANVSLDVLKDVFLDTTSSNNSRAIEVEAAIHLGGFAANIGGGFQRPLEPFGDAIRMLKGDIVVDKRINGENINQLVRYTDSMFDYLVSNDNMYVPLQKLGTTGKTEKFDATVVPPLRGQPEKALGLREEPVLSTAQRMLNQISKPYWKAGQTVKNMFPEVNNVMTKMMSFHLEWHAEEWYEQDAWQKGTNEQRQLIWKEKVVDPAKKAVELQLAASLDPENKRLQTLYEISKRKSESRLSTILDEYENYTGRTGKRKLTDLSTVELQTFIAYMDDYDAMKIREIEAMALPLMEAN